MPSLENPEIVFDIGDSNKSGLYKDFNSDGGASLGLLVSKNGLPLKFRLVRASTVESRPWTDINFSGATIEWAVSNPEIGPASGTWSLSYNTDSTGLTALAYNITATALQTALNANPTLSSGGASVTVTAYAGQNGKTSFSIVWNAIGTRSVLVGTSINLFPLSTVTVSELQAGSASKVEIQVIELSQAPYAYSNSWTSYANATCVVQSLQTGSAAQLSVQRIHYNVQPYDGVLTVNAPISEITDVTAQANVGAENLTQVVTVADVSNSLAGTYFDIADMSGPVRVWLSFNSAPAPTTPSGGRLIAVTGISTGNNAVTVAGHISSIVGADSQYIAGNIGATVAISDKIYGLRTAGVDGAVSPTGFAITTPVAGNSGPLTGLYFVLQDVNGSVAVWFSTPNATTIPAGAAAQRRAIAVSITAAATETAAAVATAINSAINSDSAAEFTSAIVNTNIVRVTDAVGGDRPDASQGTTTFAVTTNQAGVGITAVVPFDSTAAQFTAQLGGYFTATKIAQTDWIITGTSYGANPPVTVDPSQMAFANGLYGVLPLNTWGMFLAFANATTDTIQLTIEGKITFPGDPPYTFFQQAVSVSRTVIDLNAIAPVTIGGTATNPFGLSSLPFSPIITGYTGGGNTNLDGLVTLGVTPPLAIEFNHPTDGTRIFTLTAGTTAASTSEPWSVIHPADYNASTNAKIWLSNL